MTDKDYGESTYRKKYQDFCKLLNANQSKFSNTQAQIAEIRLERQALERERVKFRDERNSYNKLIREEARKQSYEDMIKSIICTTVEPIEIDIKHNNESYLDNSMLVHITDIHTGIEIDTFNNKFNQDILKERLAYYINKIIEIQRLHNSKDCYIVVGEILSGLIHPNLRLQNNMDLMEQFKYISELLSSCLINISGIFDNIYVYTTPGNHSRISPKKEESLDGENMDVLLPFYLKARLQNITNIHIQDNIINPEIAMFVIHGTKIFAAHGHKDKPSQVVQNFTMMYNMKPDIVLLGHRHTNGMTTVYDAKVIESGSVSGADDYAISIRKVNKPEQTVSIIDDNGLVCLYDIQLP